MPKIYLAISGTLGVGKSTMTRFIASEFDFLPVYESFKDNPFLPRFYEDMKRWAFHSQIFFLIAKVRQLSKLAKSNKNIVQDTPVYQDVYSYAKAQYICKNMNRDEWQNYLGVFSLLEKKLPKPDLIINLTAPVNVIYDRIKKRNRDGETTGSKINFLNYLKVLDSLNEKWINGLKKKIKVVTINTDGNNYFNDDERKKIFKNQLKRLLQPVFASLRRGNRQ